MKKGSMFAWVIITVLVFIVGFVWIMFSEILYEGVFPAFDNLSTNNETSDTYEQIKDVWAYWPLLLIFGLVVYGIAQALRREPYSQYG